ncbi:hypothetical protein [Dyella sp. ASV21]|nr:hypothetical protein [Dyella sp. ASV21]
MLDFTIVHPEGYELCEDFTPGATISHNLEDCLLYTSPSPRDP